MNDQAAAEADYWSWDCSCGKHGSAWTEQRAWAAVKTHLRAVEKREGVSTMMGCNPEVEPRRWS